jgi:predicted Ser/Thr protein kinase
MGPPPSDHPAPEVLDGFGLGRLDAWAAEAVGRHLESCPSCRRRVAEVTSDTFLDRFRGAHARSDPLPPTGPLLAEAPIPGGGPALPVPPPVDAPPRVRNYQVLECLGDGGQGSAYLARDPGLGRLVVLKRYHADGLAVEQEGQALARVRSRYTAQCYALERQGDDLFLVMEYIPGPTLAEVRKQRVVAPVQVVHLVEQVAEGLEAVHACGLLHRDIKPSNIVLGDDGVPRLVDFGLAAHLGSAALRSISGSPPYMAPEQARGQWERIDARTDVFGLGAVLYHLLTGQPPREGRTPVEILAQARDEPIVPLRRKNPRVPRALEQVCLKAMASDPQSRFPSAAALRGALRRYRRTRRAAAILGAAVVVLAAIATAWAVRPAPSRPTAGRPARAIASPASLEDGSEPIPAAPSNLWVTRFEIHHFPGSDPGRVGTLGQGSFAAREDDQLTVRAELSEPAYSYLIAFRPDGTDELCDPEDEGALPPRNQRPGYPPLSKSDEQIRLSEGTGLYALALVVSREPLPAYRQWKRRNGPAPWAAKLPGEPGVVWRDDDLGLQPFLAVDPSDVRGKGAKARGSGEPAARLATWLRGRPGVDVVTLEAFTVRAASEP